MARIAFVNELSLAKSLAGMENVEFNDVFRIMYSGGTLAASRKAFVSSLKVEALCSISIGNGSSDVLRGRNQIL
jgi:hypothetical protein